MNIAEISPPKARAMACYSVIQDLRRNGPSSRVEICKSQGLAELNAAAAIRLAIDGGWVRSAGQLRFYVDQDLELPTVETIMQFKVAP